MTSWTGSRMIFSGIELARGLGPKRLGNFYRRHGRPASDDMQGEINDAVRVVSNGVESPRMKLSLPIFLALASVMSIALPASAKEVKVSIAKLRFTPAVVQVSPGDTVVWTNDDDRGHTVIADDGSFSSSEIGIGATYRQ